MDGITSNLELQTSLLQQNVALSVLKSAAKADRQVADIIAGTVSPSSRGQSVNISA